MYNGGGERDRSIGICARSSVVQAFPDNACKREILALEVYCVNKDSGCPWVGVLKVLEVSTYVWCSL